MSQRDRILGALWGAIVGDALGVPVEFQHRGTLQAAPVLGMRGFGSHNQPPGTWSDDSSMTLCTIESLLETGFDTDDMGRRFVDWYNAERWTPWGKVFDIGMTTRSALLAVARGTKAELAGGITESSNGNGSLMRILPVALHGVHVPVAEMSTNLPTPSNHDPNRVPPRNPRRTGAPPVAALVAGDGGPRARDTPSPVAGVVAAVLRIARRGQGTGPCVGAPSPGTSP